MHISVYIYIYTYDYICMYIYNISCISLSHMLHVWYIYLQNWVILSGQMLVNVPDMEHMGVSNFCWIFVAVSLICVFFILD